MPRIPLEDETGNTDENDSPTTETSEQLNDLIMPDPKSIVSETTFISPKGTKFKIIRTNERDEYEEVPKEKKQRRRSKD